MALNSRTFAFFMGKRNTLSLFNILRKIFCQGDISLFVFAHDFAENVEVEKKTVVGVLASYSAFEPPNLLINLMKTKIRLANT